MSVNLPSILPLFPLPVVLFPGQFRELRVFEQRYRNMLRDCLDQDQPFGIVLAKRVRPNAAEPLPHRVGTSAHIVQVARQEDGTFSIQIYGGERFRVQSFVYDQPYLQGEVEAFPLKQTHGGDLPKKLRQVLPRYLDELTRASGYRFSVQTIPEEPEQLAYLTAVALQLNNEQKQEMLGIADLHDLLIRELHMLAGELDLMAWINETIEGANLRAFGVTNDLSLN